MPACLKSYWIVPPSIGVTQVLRDKNGINLGMPVPNAQALLPEVIPTTAIADCAFVGISGAEYLALQAAVPAQDMDYAIAGALFTFALSSVVGLYLAANSVGSILGLIRRA